MTETRKKVPTLVEKLIAKLVAGGISARKAKEVAPTLVPVARATVKKEIEQKAAKADGIGKGDSPSYDASQVPATRARKSATASPTAILPVTGGKGAELLQTIMGLSSGASYRVAAVKGEEALVAIKGFGDSFKLKFYPDMASWGFTFERLVPIGASSHLVRTLEGGKCYERAMFTTKGAAEVLHRIDLASSPRARAAKAPLAKRLRVACLDALKSVFASLSY